MIRSLRFRLPALFLLGIVLAAVVATLIAVRFFQSNTRSHAASELRAESAGLAQLYEQKAGIGRVSLVNLQIRLGSDKVFASNTSTLPITSLATESKRPKNFIGIHFFSPVERMMLVEIIKGKNTGDAALAVALYATGVWIVFQPMQMRGMMHSMM